MLARQVKRLPAVASIFKSGGVLMSPFQPRSRKRWLRCRHPRYCTYPFPLCHDRLSVRNICEAIVLRCSSSSVSPSCVKGRRHESMPSTPKPDAASCARKTIADDRRCKDGKIHQVRGEKAGKEGGVNSKVSLTKKTLVVGKSRLHSATSPRVAMIMASLKKRRKKK
ncbi:uncharacterized protein K489DRAFT_252380 [Dissoconium aciculare CBS 342.82]|uniref:Uncharacterized protein n=1 Tax=Dissoconium aciculare CBS 342.82 TaxID=1314786 RepID=A0A6J3M0T8_9PEZI|nr:uncharacterized protein K489DRAFT_252380 [Dissoconium aciculare CBS 342.82]KAF1821636.1 hypothetical protein K489DRAFT_252380 [Dissoconium aciculare CBS 342.82]